MAIRYVDNTATYSSDGLLKAPASYVTGTSFVSIASPCVITWAGHGLSEGTKVFFYNTSSTLPSGLAEKTYYYVRNPATDTFNLSATVDGALINTSGSQSGTHVLLTQGCYSGIASMIGLSSAIYAGYMLPDPGDTFIIRTADANGDDWPDELLTTTASRTQADIGQDGLDPLTYIFDDGTEWTYAGQVTIKVGQNGAYWFQFRTGTTIYGNNRCTFLDVRSSEWDFITVNDTRFKECAFSSIDSGGRSRLYGSGEFDNCTFSFKKGESDVTDPRHWFGGQHSHNQIHRNCTYDGQYIGHINQCIFGAGMFRVYGGKFINMPEQTYLFTNTNDYAGCNIEAYGVDIGSTLLMEDCYAANLNSDNSRAWGTLEFSNILAARRKVTFRAMPNKDTYDFYAFNGRCYTSWEALGNYPTLNAQLPDGSYFSLKCRPISSSFTQKAAVFETVKDYNATAALKTITAEFLLNTAYTECTFTDSGDTVNKTAHGLSDGMSLTFTEVNTTTGISVDTTYYVVNAATDTFQVEASVGGGAIALTNDGTGNFVVDDGWFLEVEYVDTSGVFNFETTEGTLKAVDASTNSAWENYNSGTGYVGYASSNYNAYKISLDTSSQVKEDTEIVARLVQKAPMPTSTSFFFVDPDFNIATTT